MSEKVNTKLVLAVLAQAVLDCLGEEGDEVAEDALKFVCKHDKLIQRLKRIRTQKEAKQWKAEIERALGR